jgi:3-oxoacyl-[acyl-carrier-protein] synthase-3
MPNAPVSNDAMEALLGQAGGRPSRARRTILRSNGITARHYAVDPATHASTHTNAQMTAEAVRALGADIGAVSCLVAGTSIADQLMPNHAVMVQGELAWPPCEVVATSGVCLAGLTALKYAFMGVASGLHPNAVATGSEAASAVLSARNFAAESDAKVDALEAHPELAFEKDFLRWMLSDGAGAVLVEPAPRADGVNLRIDWIETFSYAGEMEPCMYAGAVKNPDGTLSGWTQMSSADRDLQSVMAVKQDVKLLNAEVIRYTVEKPLPVVAAKHGIRPGDIDHFLPHYSSAFFREKVRDGMVRAGFDIPQERWFTNLATKGNTGSASMYIMLEELLRTRDIARGARILCWVPESGRFSCGFMHLTAV